MAHRYPQSPKTGWVWHEGQGLLLTVMGTLDRMQVVQTQGEKTRRREIRAPREKRGRINTLLHSQPRLGGPGWCVREIIEWQVCQSEAELIRPQGRGQLRPGEALLTTGLLSWGKAPEHWDGHIILPREGFLSVCRGRDFPIPEAQGICFGGQRGEHCWGSGWIGPGHGGHQVR